MSSLHAQAKKVFAVPLVTKCVWNHVTGNPDNIAAGGQRDSHGIGDPFSYGHFDLDHLCGAGAAGNRAAENDFLATQPATAQAPGWWFDIKVAMDQPGRMVLNGHWEIDNRANQGAFWTPAAYPEEVPVEEFLISASVEFHSGHLWWDHRLLHWTLHNEGALATTFFAVELRFKAGV